MNYRTKNLSNDVKDNWAKLPNELITATKITNKATGETLDFDFRWVSILMYMQQRQTYFKSNGDRYFESWDSILYATIGTGYTSNSTSRKMISKLVAFGLLSCATSGKRLKNKGAKGVVTMQQLRDHFEFSNPQFEAFNTEEQKQKRKEGKKARIQKWKDKKASKPEQQQPEVTQESQPILDFNSAGATDSDIGWTFTPDLSDTPEGYHYSDLADTNTDHVVDDPQTEEDATQEDTPEEMTLSELVKNCNGLPFSRAGGLKPEFEGYSMDEVKQAVAAFKATLDICPVCGKQEDQFGCTDRGCSEHPDNVEF